MLISSNVNLSRGRRWKWTFLFASFHWRVFWAWPAECAAQWDNTCPGPKSGSRGRDRLVCRHLQRPPSAATPPHVAHQSGTDLGLSFTHVTSPPSLGPSYHQITRGGGRQGVESPDLKRLPSRGWYQAKIEGLAPLSDLRFAQLPTIGPNGSLPPLSLLFCFPI